MRLDFDQLKRLKDSFHEQFRQDGEVGKQLNKGTMVYSINFNPSEGTAQVHVQWPYFRNLVANESDYPATYRKIESEDQQAWIHWECSVLGVKVVACMERDQIIEEITNAYPAWKEHANLEKMDIELLMEVFMGVTGWNTIQTEDEEVKDNG